MKQNIALKMLQKLNVQLIEKYIYIRKYTPIHRTKNDYAEKVRFYKHKKKKK